MFPEMPLETLLEMGPGTAPETAPGTALETLPAMFPVKSLMIREGGDLLRAATHLPCEMRHHWGQATSSRITPGDPNAIEAGTLIGGIGGLLLDARH